MSGRKSMRVIRSMIAVALVGGLPAHAVAQGLNWTLDPVAILQARRVSTSNPADARCEIEIGSVGKSDVTMRMVLFLDKRMFGISLNTTIFTRESLGIVQLESETAKLLFNMQLAPGSLTLFNAQPTLIGFIEQAGHVTITSPYVKSGLLIRINIPQASVAVPLLRTCQRQAADAQKREWCEKYVMPHDEYCGRP